MATNAGFFGSFVPTTNVWDVGQLQDIDVTSPEFKELLVRLYQNLNLMAIVVNSRDAGYYVPQQFVNGQLWYPNPNLDSTSTTNPTLRQVMRLMVPFGALPNTGTKSVAHGITVNSSYSFTRIYATATDPVAMSYIPIPYASPTLANNIELSVDATNVTITTGSNRSSYTTCYVVLEYLMS